MINGRNCPEISILRTYKLENYCGVRDLVNRHHQGCATGFYHGAHSFCWTSAKLATRCHVQETASQKYFSSVVSALPSPDYIYGLVFVPLPVYLESSTFSGRKQFFWGHINFLCKGVEQKYCWHNNIITMHSERNI